MAKIVKKSPAPVYAVAAVWLVFGLFLPLYKLFHFALATALSVAAFLLVKRLRPDQIIEVPDPTPEPKPENTGNAELDALIRERDRALSEMRRLNDNIKDEKISMQIDHMEDITRKIIAHVVEYPQKLPQIRKFLSYYLPTTLKLLNAYDRMGAAGISGTNIDGTMGKIETMMDTVVAAFDRQLDALFRDEALDISTDITVMENLLKSEGLSGGRPFGSAQS
ncbi:MAG: 5-bromo-4-chloroindolyl phosphate hydrolysis family protein [Intestinimonas sp.]|nr:5-bromo-4-chloroindolyl phosphate hydrolysis family protein [Intestinimonas sp.]